MIDYHVVRSHRRKTLSLQVKQGKVLVRAPHFVEDSYISSLVQEKSTWLKSKIFEQSSINQEYCRFEQGSSVLYKGQVYLLNISFGKKSDIFVSAHSDNKACLTIILPERNKNKFNDELLCKAAVKKLIENFFKLQAEKVILPKVAYYSELTQRQPSNIKIRQYKARWGSCNSKGELSFNYLMMMMPDTVVDYIVIHELCHLHFLDHSTNFWQLVAKYCPDYLQSKRWLKIHQSQLLWQTP